MKKKSRNLEIYPELLDDLINLEYLIVFNNYGITLYSVDIGRVEILDLLISGLLQAIITMIKEISPQKISKKEDRIEVKEISGGEQGLLVYYCQSIPSDENSIIVASFCSKTCSNHFKTRLKEITTIFSQTYRDQILNFAGNTEPFEDSAAFFENHLWIDLLYPLQLPKSDMGHLKDSDDEILGLYNIIKDFNRKLAQNEGIFVKEIIEIALRNLKLTYFELLALIIKFFNESLLEPVSIKHSQIEKEIILKETIQNEDILNLNETNLLDSVNSLDNINEMDKKAELNFVEKQSLNTEASSDKADSNNLDSVKVLDNSTTHQEEANKEITSGWFLEFIEKLRETPEVTIKNENLIISTLIREIEYEFHLKDSKLYQGKLEDLKKINFKLNQYFLTDHSMNLFSGPKFVLVSNREKKTIISGMLTRNKYIIILGH